MLLSDAKQCESVFVSDGVAIQRLSLRPMGLRGVPSLVGAVGTVVNPWEVELVRWPRAAETALRRGGYLTDRHWSVAEPWCNCAD